MKNVLLNLSKLLHGHEVELSAAQTAIIPKGLSLDSRSLESGYAFIAVDGSKAHGCDFLEMALEKKPCVVIYEPTEQYNNLTHEQVEFVAMPNLSKYVSLIASRFYADPSESLSITAITGTNGKTSCAYLLTQLLTSLGLDAAMIGTIGSGRIDELKAAQLTTPDAISLQAKLADFKEAGISHVVMEASSHALHQHRLDAVAVDVAAFTNLSQDHLDYHADMSEYLDAKARLFAFDTLSHAVLNADESVSQILLASLNESVEKITYSCNGELADLRADSIEFNSSNTRFNLRVADENYSVISQLIGEFNVANLLLVVSVMRALGYSVSSFIENLKLLNAPQGRMQRLGGADAPLVVIDYAHTHDALEKALVTLQPLSKRKLAAVFGCGGDRDKKKRPLMGAIAERYASPVYLTDDNPRTEKSLDIISDIQKGINDKSVVQIIPDRARAISVSIQEAAIEDVVLIAGKGHEDYQIIGHEKIAFSDQLHAQAALDIWQELRS